MFPRLCALLIFCNVVARAQPGCGGLQYQTAVPAASGATQILARDTDGSYASYEVTFTVPLRVVKKTSGYGAQLARCVPLASPSRRPVPPFVGPAVLNQAATVLPSGNIQFNVLPGNVAQPSLLVEQITYTPQLQLLTDRKFQLPLAAAGALVADVNGDGLPDLIATDFYCVRQQVCGGFHVYLGTLDGGFSATASQAFPAPLFPVLLTDINHDGRPDLLVRSRPVFGAGPLLLMLGKPDGTLADPAVIAGVSDSNEVAVADFNRDGNADLALFTPDGLAIVLGDGAGGFGGKKTFPASGGQILTGDLNGDGVPDIVVGNSVFLVDATGAITSRTDYQFGTARFIADINNDGVPDLVDASGAVLFGLGDGRFYGAVVVANESNLNAVPVDVDEDGIPELATASDAGVKVLRSNRDGTFSPLFAFAPAGCYVTRGVALQVGDWNGDGKPDLLVACNSQSENSLVALINLGGGQFRPVYTAVAPGTVELVSGDWNGDGKLDVAYITAQLDQIPGSTNSVVIQLGLGDGAFAAPTRYPTYQRPSEIVSGHFRGMRVPDLLVIRDGSGTEPPNLALYPNQGDGRFLLGLPIDLPIRPTRLSNLVAADLNGDGVTDAGVNVSDQQSGFYGIFLGQGNGTFRRSPGGLTGSGVPIKAADVDGDGVLDLLTNAAYYPGNGDGTFGPASQQPWAEPLAVADFTGDGKPDVVAYTGSTGAALFVNVSRPGTAVVSAATNRPGTLAPESLATVYGTKLSATAGQTTVSVVDSTATERPAPVLFSSAAQINFEVPAGTAAGTAAVRIKPLGGPEQNGSVSIAPVAPALFVSHPWNSDVAVGFIVVVAADDSQTTFSTATQVELRGAKQAIFVLFGTGFRNATSGVTATVDGLPSAVLYAGPAPGFLGLDQINIQAPKALDSYYRSIPFAISAGGSSSNTVFASLIAAGFPN